ncbi:DUF393 domain-containing protein, partial [bacterium]|nr:DUF393 domain-containing protein [bacterium]
MEKARNAVFSCKFIGLALVFIDGKTANYFFDGYCGLCNGFVDFVMARDHKKTFRFATLQGATAARLLSKDDVENLNSVVVYIHQQTFKKSRAVLQVFADLGGAWKILSYFGFLPTP